MLPGPGFGDQTLLSHVLCQQCLPKRVVEFMRSPVDKVFPLQVHPAPEFLRSIRAERERSLSSGILRLQHSEIPGKYRIPADFVVRGLQFYECAHERLGHILSTVFPVSSFSFHVTHSCMQR